MKDVFKIGIITLLLCVSAVLFQYLGYGNIDYFIMFLTFLGIGMTIFTFYKSALKKDYKLFTLLIAFVLMFFSFFIYKKNNDKKNYELMKSLIEVNKTLLNYKHVLNGLTVSYNLADSDKKYKSNYKFVDEYNNNIKSIQKEVRETHNVAVRMLSKYQLSNLSTDIVIEMKKYIEEFNQNKEKLDKLIDKYKIEKNKIEERKHKEEENIKNIKKKEEEEEKKRKEEEERKRKEEEENEKRKKEEEELKKSKKGRKNKKSKKEKVKKNKKNSFKI